MLAILAGIILCLGDRTALAADWQWSVPVPPLADRTSQTPRAYPWVPDHCAQIKGVVFAQHNMEEESVLELPVFRKTLAHLGFAEVWVVPGFDCYFRFHQDAGPKFDTMMNDMAAESGCAELTTTPLVPMGPSAAASLPWYMAAASRRNHLPPHNSHE